VFASGGSGVWIGRSKKKSLEEWPGWLFLLRLANLMICCPNYDAFSQGPVAWHPWSIPLVPLAGGLVPKDKPAERMQCRLLSSISLKYIFYCTFQKYNTELYYYYYCILHLSAKRYEELLAIRLGKPLIDKNLRRASFASFLCSPLLIYNSRYYHMLYSL
jgi:hypothetical protein